jgi:hypothetical protein
MAGWSSPQLASGGIRRRPDPGNLDALEFEQLGCQSAVEEVPDILVIAG